MTKWEEFSIEDRMAWAEWALENGKEDMPLEERIAWVSQRATGRQPDVSLEDRAFLPISQKSVSNRLRARRYKIFSRLDKFFGVYEVFTPSIAAAKTGIKLEVMVQYLNYEASLPSSRIAREGPTAYKIITGFEIGG